MGPLRTAGERQADLALSAQRMAGAKGRAA